MRHGCVPAPYSIYEGVRKVEPASIVTVSPGGRSDSARYWVLEDVIRHGLAHPLTGSDTDITDQVERELSNAVAQQMVADVPIGAFLSGGIDSSAIVALMQAQSSRPVRTFTIGFHDGAYDEATHARAVADHLKTDHTELYISPEEARSVIPLLPRMFDEPFADSSQIPTYLVAKLARQHVTVALSGDGGDELFGGLLPLFHRRPALARAGAPAGVAEEDRRLGGHGPLAEGLGRGGRRHPVGPARSRADASHRRADPQARDGGRRRQRTRLLPGDGVVLAAPVGGRLRVAGNPRAS